MDNTFSFLHSGQSDRSEVKSLAGIGAEREKERDRQRRQFGSNREEGNEWSRCLTRVVVALLAFKENDTLAARRGIICPVPSPRSTRVTDIGARRYNTCLLCLSHCGILRASSRFDGNGPSLGISALRVNGKWRRWRNIVMISSFFFLSLEMENKGKWYTMLIGAIIYLVN